MATQNCSRRWSDETRLIFQVVRDFNQDSYSFDLKTYVLHYQNQTTL